MRIILLLTLISFTSLSCRKDCIDYTDPECENYNPCWDQKEVSAKFKVFETYDFPVPYTEKWYSIYETDTFFSSALFVAECEDCEYTWLIGGGVYNTKNVNLGFTRLPALSQVEITLITKRKPNLNCYPNDDGVDTFSKIVMVGKNEGNNFFKTRPNLEFPELIFNHDFLEIEPKNFIARYLLVDSLASTYIGTFENLLHKNDKFIVNAGHGGTKHGIFEIESDSITAIMGIYWIAPKTYNIKIEAKNKIDINPEIRNYSFTGYQN